MKRWDARKALRTVQRKMLRTVQHAAGLAGIALCLACGLTSVRDLELPEDPIAVRYRTPEEARLSSIRRTLLGSDRIVIIFLLIPFAPNKKAATRQLVGHPLNFVDDVCERIGLGMVVTL